MAGSLELASSKWITVKETKNAATLASVKETLDLSIGDLSVIVLSKE
jgi:hypothetical protein